ncbi:MAG: multifunctional CCA addition/repair protein [Burkholderiales bacterium]|nr:MAG: multifunctional CCA addition/repair protein [Burkholderiales bacterium]
MKTYLVGGAVRDALMGRAVTDRDWCVVGSSPQEMLDAGYLPVGKDFPVFLHPKTKEEYALARTERKTAPGYHGFEFHATPDVTIEQDLARRDLTINSIAVCADFLTASSRFDLKNLPQDAVIDPYGGQKDIQEKLLRHTSHAFEEDPVRILRVARFAARYEGFSVAKPTMDLMRRMVAAGEVDALVAERVWQEIAKGLMENKPSRMFQVLRQCGALQVLLPEVEQLWGVPQRAEYHPEIDTGVHLMMVLDMAAQLQAPLPVRFACLVHDLGKGTTPQDVLPRHIGHEIRSVDLLLPICERLRVPTECKELAVVVAKEHGNIHRSAELDAKATLRLLERCDAIRKPQRFLQVLQACECDARGRLGLQDEIYMPALRLASALQKVLSVPTAEIAQQAMAEGKRTEQIGRAIAAARAQILEKL